MAAAPAGTTKGQTLRNPVVLALSAAVVVLVIILAMLTLPVFNTANGIGSYNVPALKRQLSTQETWLNGNSSRISTLNSQIASDNSKITALQAQVSSDDAQISSLQSQLSSLQAQTASSTTTIDNLQAEVSSLQSQISSDASQISNLQTQDSSLQSQVSSDTSQIASLQAASVSGSFSVATSCPLFGNCSYSITGAYANYGTNTANSASVTFTFYSSTQQSLCVTTVSLGSVAGHSITLFPQTNCNSNYNIAAGVYTTSFSYT